MNTMGKPTLYKERWGCKGYIIIIFLLFVFPLRGVSLPLIVLSVKYSNTTSVFWIFFPGIRIYWMSSDGLSVHFADSHTLENSDEVLVTRNLPCDTCSKRGVQDSCRLQEDSLRQKTMFWLN